MTRVSASGASFERVLPVRARQRIRTIGDHGEAQRRGEHDELIQRQPTAPFSDAWHESYGRRNLSETANSYLQGSFVNIEEEYARFLTTTKIESWLVYTIAEANRRIVSNFVDFQRDKDTIRIRRPRRDRATRISDLKTHPSPTSRHRANGKSPPG